MATSTGPGHLLADCALSPAAMCERYLTDLRTVSLGFQTSSVLLVTPSTGREAFGMLEPHAFRAMTPESVLHHRRSVRLRGHDYASPATYLVTICTHERSSLFGTMVNGEVQLNEAGTVVGRCWQAIPDHFSDALLDAWTVMPDHVHGIIRIAGRGDACVAPTMIPTPMDVPRGPRPRSLAVIVEQIIRDADALDRARDYIRAQYRSNRRA